MNEGGKVRGRARRPARLAAAAAAGLAIPLALALTIPLTIAGCAGPGRLPGPARGDPLHAARELGRRGGDDAARRLGARLSDPVLAREPDVVFALGATGSDLAPGLLAQWLDGVPTDADPALLGAAALGLGASRSPEAGDVLLRLARRPERPPEALEALFSFHRWSGVAAPSAVPDPGLAAYAESPDPRRRAALAHYLRVVRDPAFVDPLLRLARDADPEVRIAAALALGQGAGAGARPAEDGERCAAALASLLGDADPRVAVSAARSLSSYGPDGLAQRLRPLLAHADPGVRVAAAESLGAKAAPGAEDALERLARDDPSPSVRYAAATSLGKIDAPRAAGLADALLASESDVVRSAGAEVLAGAELPGSVARLARLAAEDPHVRVRETALGGLEGREGPEVLAAVARGLADPDPVVVAVAAGVAASNGLVELAPRVRDALVRFEGPLGADAREGALDALGKLGLPEDDRLLVAGLSDPEPGVRHAAAAALAGRAGVRPPEPDRAPFRAAPLPADDVDLVLDTDAGRVRLRLFPRLAPHHVAHVTELARRGFYDGLTWHRVVPSFVVQGGCPRGDGAGNAGVSLRLEPARLPFTRGTLGMPRSSHPDTGGCQLFVCHARAPHLDVHYTAFGQVVEGLEVIDRIDVGSRIRSARVEPASGAAR